MFKNKKVNFALSIILKVLIIVFCLTGVIAGAYSDTFMSQKQFLYFTIQSNVCIALISFVFLILEIIKFKKPEFTIPNYMYIIKYIFTVAITLTFIVFSIILTPTMIVKGHGWYLSTIENVCLHNLVPIFAILDYCLFNFHFMIKKSTFVWGLAMPLYYLIFVSSLIFAGTDFGDGAKAPYFFLDFKTNSWFNIVNGQLGTFYWIIIIAVFVLLISLLLLWIKLLISKKVRWRKNVKKTFIELKETDDNG